jgi:hypothetical protein
MEAGFKSWVGQPVVLKVSAGDVTVPLRGTIVGEGLDTVRFRIGEGWDVDIFKSMVLAVEEESWISLIT